MRFLQKGAALAATVGMAVLPATAAHAASNSVSDGTGDTVTAANDITDLDVTFDLDTVVITADTNAALPALTDSSWAATPDVAGRTFITQLRLNNEPSNEWAVVVSKAGAALWFNGDETDCDVTPNITSGNISVTLDSECLGKPGVIAATAALGDNFADTPDPDAVDYAIAGTDLSDVDPVVASEPGGYYILGEDGGVFAFGDAEFHGSMGGEPLNAPIVAMAPTPTGNGYYLVASDGGVFAFGDAVYKGSRGGQHLNAPIVGITVTDDGYYLVASDGGIFSYGTQFYGSKGGEHLNAPVVGISATPSGDGYFIAASDGGVFAYGDARFEGSMGGHTLNSPVVGVAALPAGEGYYLVAHDGGVFAYGDATFLGSGGDTDLGDVEGITVDGDGYRLLGSSGVVSVFGDDYYYSDLVGFDISPSAPPIGITALP